MIRIFAGFAAALTAISMVLAGCSKPTTDGAQTAAGAGDVAAGKTVYAANNCTNCHAIGGQGGRMGPELPHTGAEAGHTPAWLAEHVKDPKAHNPGSRMPSYAGRIADKDLAALGAYLASLK